jgi:hypothetical protein
MINSNQELLDATYKTFVTDRAPFGWDPNIERCVYHGKNGEKCAIGIHLTNFDRRFNSNSVLSSDLPSNIWNAAFGEQVDRNFADCIQERHDDAARKANHRHAEEGAVYGNFVLELQGLAQSYGLLDPARMEKL